MPRKQRPRKIPVGYRLLTSTERTDSKTRMTLKVVSSPNYQGIPCKDYTWSMGILSKEEPSWYFFKPIKSQPSTLTSPINSNELNGTPAANTPISLGNVESPEVSVNINKHN